MDSLNTPKPLSKLFIIGIETCLDSLTSSDLTGFPPEYRNLFKDQMLIGWYTIFQGKLHNNWENIYQSQAVPSFSPSLRLQNKTWTFQILSLVLKSWMLLWKERNTSVHGATLSSQQTLKRAALLKELKHYLSNRSKFEHFHQQALPESVQQAESLSLWSLQSWFSLYRTTFHQALATFKKTKSQPHEANTHIL